MPFFKRFTHKQIEEMYNKRGWFLLCPIWAREDADGDLTVTERNWVPEWWFTVNARAFDAWAILVYTATGRKIDFIFFLEDM